VLAEGCTGCLSKNWTRPIASDWERAEAIQRTIDDPHPPFDAGHMRKASEETQRLAKEIMGSRMPADQQRLVPRIAWRRLVDLIRTGK
jgi:hypothetical protein